MKRRDPQPANRQGAVTVAVIIVLILLTAMTAQLARKAILQRRQTRNLLQQQQAAQLATAGLQRAKLKHAGDPEYSGETWTIPPGILHDRHSGNVEIEIKDGQVLAVARYPSNQPTPFKVTQTRGLTP